MRMKRDRCLKRSMAIPDFARDILRTLEEAGFEAYCVGGCVRDTLLGREPGDWDITTSAWPEETLALFGEDALPTGLRHGTVTVRRPGGCAEVTTFRRDGDYTDHRHPESVAFTDSLTEDLARRDFTVNAMALSLRGELRDPFHGREDLAAGCIRCVGEPVRRFGEDALRILRGLRFAAVLGFQIEPETAALSAARENLRAIAPERILTEVRKLLTAERPSAVLREFPEVFGVFWSELLPMLGYDQRNFHHCYDLWEHTLHALDAVPGEESLRFAALFHDVGKPDCFSLDRNGVGHFYGHAAKSAELADGMLARLRAPNALRQEVTELIRRHDTPLPGIPEANLRRLLRRLGEERLRRLIALQRADNLAQAPAFRAERSAGLDEVLRRLDAILAEDACFSLRQLAVNGRDLMALGLRGREIGGALDYLLNEVVEGRLPNERGVLLTALQERYPGNGTNRG